MKAEELMIGDWVYSIGAKKPSQISFISDDEIASYGSPQNEWGVYVDDFEPILLTDEMLKSNGFDIDKRFCDLFDENDKPVLRLNKTDKGLIVCGTASIKLNYVHEIQHLLRLCRYNDIADNFKVE